MTAASPMPLFGGSPVLAKAVRLDPPLPPMGVAGLAGTPLERPRDTSLCPSGNGDILSYEDANRAMQTGVAGIMIAR